MENSERGIRTRSSRRAAGGRVALGLLAVAVLLGAAALSRSGARPAAPPDRMTLAGPSEGRGQDASRKRIDQLIGEQKFEEAAKEAARIRSEAKRAGDERLWAWALIREVQLRTALHGYETAVRFLREEPWPSASVPNAMLDLFYAGTLATYRAAYSWEIRGRERVEAKGPVDLKAWTSDQIDGEAWSALMRVWKVRDRLASLKAREFPDIWDPGDYPAGIRDTLRDGVVYLMARFLADTGTWTPRQSNEAWLLDLERLLSASPSDTAKAAAVLESTDAHPLEKLRALLAEHAAWCERSADRPEGALEARLEVFAAVHASFAKEDDRTLVRARLADMLGSFRKFPWWAAGQALLAEFTRAEDAPDALVRARSLALAGVEAFPSSPGGRRCQHIVKSIEAPDYAVEMMAADAPGRRSVRFTHRNLATVFLRAYPVDLMERIRTSKDYNLFPEWNEARAVLDKGRPAAAWKLDLPATPDYRDHRTYVDLPPGLAPGLYLVAASARADFARGANSIRALSVVVGDLVLLRRPSTEGGIEAIVVSGSTGRPLQGITVDLYAFDWQKGHNRADRRAADAEGRVRFTAPPQRQGPYFLIAAKDNDLAIDPDYMYLYAGAKPAETGAALIYTDRSIYRPGQKLYWKVLGFRGRRDLGRLKPSANGSASIWLEDINGQRVAEASCALNAFGTASGEFVIPAAGRPLGAWRLRTSPEGYAQVRVEEYKRPTFEVSVKDPEKPLRLNRPAALKGEARYYFGLPVASGSAVWQVKRERVYPRWWWWGAPDAGKSQVVAGGRVPLREDGTVEITFTPRVDERGGAAGTTFRYTLSLDVTDEGGETRTATRSFRLGFVSVEATIAPGGGFLREGDPAAFDLMRADLNGTPKPGKGSWRIVRLVRPDATLLPSELPLPEPPATQDKTPFRTAGDRLRSRWDAAPDPDNILRLWKEGAEAARGAVAHDAQGRASLKAGVLEAGAYRVLYETKDDFGAVCRESLSFLVSGRRSETRLPLICVAETDSVPVGGTARLLVHSGFAGQPVLLETFKGGEVWQCRWLDAGKDGGLLEIPVTEDLRGGFGARATLVRDHQFVTEEANVFVPWDDKELAVSFATFRDKLLPGGRETWRINVKTPDGKPALRGAAELLAYMYDRSLDLFAPHDPPRVTALYPYRAGTSGWDKTLGLAPQAYADDSGWGGLPGYPVFRPDQLVQLGGYGIGGPGVRGRIVGGVLREDRVAMPMAAAQKSVAVEGAKEELEAKDATSGMGKPQEAEPAPEAAVPLRSNFSETAFWQPHLLTGPDGSAAVEFTVPDSVTGWRVFVHGVTKDLQGGVLQAEAKTVKELMVRPYLPRFFREGDRAELRVVVNNAGEADLAGAVSLEISDPATGENLAPAFALPASVPARPFAVKPGAGATVVFPLAAPARVGTVAFKVTAKAGAFSDGELRPLPVLPGRMHLVQSRFATLKEGVPRDLTFADIAKTDDATRTHEQLVVTVDAQLFYGLLEALPYLVNYPYECTEQTLNRFLSTGILTSLYTKYPSVGRMAQALSKRETLYESFDAADPNRKMGLEETPWLVTARGGEDAGYGMERVLDPKVAAAQREASLAKLLKAQTSLGAFPWWPGGPPSPYMTLYIVHGFSKALEFGVAVPKDPVVRAFAYLHRHFLDEIVKELMANDAGWEFVTFLNYTLSNFPDASWTGGVFTDKERKEMLDFSFRHWKEHAPYLKGYLALTLKRAARPKDAALVWDSVMDSAKTTVDEGTSWAPEDRGWLWYNDAIETHAFALRTLMELKPDDGRSEGLVQWLFLNKKLNHWKSTRATSEVIYSVAWFLKQTGALGARESVAVEACGTRTTFVFEPDKYTGKKNQVVVPGPKLGPECATVRAAKEGKGMAFASATWHFSTDRMPDKGEGDLFAVERTYFRRLKRGDEVVLKPLADGEGLAVGDELEVQLSIRARHAAEYVHLRDPRPSGCEPATLTSGYKWDLGLVRYEEIRDSGTNFFMEWLPQGEYTLKHRLRCAMAGTFKAAPATLQSMYAPEFAAYSSGRLIEIRAE
jgi:alpha-2-macroglobulin